MLFPLSSLPLLHWQRLEWCNISGQTYVESPRRLCGCPRVRFSFAFFSLSSSCVRILWKELMGKKFRQAHHRPDLQAGADLRSRKFLSGSSLFHPIRSSPVLSWDYESTERNMYLYGKSLLSRLFSIGLNWIKQWVVNRIHSIPLSYSFENSCPCSGSY